MKRFVSSNGARDSAEPSSQTGEVRAADAGATSTRSFHPYGTLLTILWIILLGAIILSPRPRGAGSEAPTALTAIDPNTAPWWELAALPRISRSTAEQIVHYREAVNAIPPLPLRERARVRVDGLGFDSLNPNMNRPEAKAFTSATDLTKVSGIGPKTVQRLKPYLRFPASPPAQEQHTEETREIDQPIGSASPSYLPPF